MSQPSVFSTSHQLWAIFEAREELQRCFLAIVQEGAEVINLHNLQNQGFAAFRQISNPASPATDRKQMSLSAKHKNNI